MSEKEYWSVRVFIDLKDRLYEIADETHREIGEVLNECLASGLRHKDEWAKPPYVLRLRGKYDGTQEN